MAPAIAGERAGAAVGCGPKIVLNTSSTTPPLARALAGAADVDGAEGTGGGAIGTGAAVAFALAREARMVSSTIDVGCSNWVSTPGGAARTPLVLAAVAFPARPRPAAAARGVAVGAAVGAGDALVEVGAAVVVCADCRAARMVCCSTTGVSCVAPTETEGEGRAARAGTEERSAAGAPPSALESVF